MLNTYYLILNTNSMDIFSKLNSLKSIEPNKNWVVDAKKRVLSETPVFGRKSVLKNILLKVDSRLRGNDKVCFGNDRARILDKKSSLGFNLQNLFQNLSFKKLMVPAFLLVFVLSGGIFTVGASKSSLPGEFLYSIKIINEDMAMVIAPENKKVTIEVEHAGKRLEEIAEISKKTSDVEQQKKIGQLMERFEEKMSSANDRLANTSGNGEKTKVAKVINTQSKKYTEVLAKTTDDLPAVVKDEIVEEIAKAIDSSEEIYLTSLAVITEGKKTVDGAGEEDKDDSAEDGEEITDTEEDTEEEPLVSDSDDDFEEGDVKGDEDENNQLDLVDSIDDVNGEDLADEDADKSEDEEEVVSDETEEEIIKIEADEEVEESSL
ncbi:MAG: hypothetical protein JRD93_05590 [Deltaproteobacteria bacterium]|nr:hypothetical protein [Deltaproteobacteria bacterium]